MHYTFTQWVLFFFVYSFFGWIWESCYASVEQRRLVNRGFLHGPVIPIYGFGALGVLAATMDVRGSVPGIFVFGMLGATVLEYLTGYFMERLFHVKYWDYSHFPLNLNGYICLFASLAWGVFSVLLVRLVQPPIEELVLGLRRNYAEILVVVLSMAGAADTWQSCREALDLRDVLQKLEDSKEQIGRLEKRIEIGAVYKMDDYAKRLESAGGIYNPLKLQSHFMKNMRLVREQRNRQLRALLAHLDELPGREDLQKLRENVLSELQKLGARRDSEYRSIASILSRNPRAFSGKYKNAMKEIREMMR